MILVQPSGEFHLNSSTHGNTTWDISGLARKWYIKLFSWLSRAYMEVGTHFTVLITQVNESQDPYIASLAVKLEITVIWSEAPANTA